MNATSAHAFGRAPEEMVGTALADLCDGEAPPRLAPDSDEMQGRVSTDPRWHAIHEEGSAFPGEEHPAMVALHTGPVVRDVVMGVFSPATGAYRWITLNAVPQTRSGESAPYRVFTTFVDVTERVALEQELDRRARYDVLTVLTGLPNREEAFARFEAMVGHAPRVGQQTAALFCDVDRFKAVNDRRGHAILGKARWFRVERCVCRLQQDELGTRGCDFPLEACLWFSYAEGGDTASGISHEEALAVLDEAERVGLVHTVSNVASGIGYVCNCSGGGCGLLRGVTEWGIEHSVAQANYFAEIDPLTCTACGACEERCQVHAVAVKDDVRVVRRESCVGRGLCVTGCPAEAARLRRKPEGEIVAPPATRGPWERVRLRGRSVSAT